MVTRGARSYEAQSTSHPAKTEGTGCSGNVPRSVSSCHARVTRHPCNVCHLRLTARHTLGNIDHNLVIEGAKLGGQWIGRHVLIALPAHDNLIMT
jgi:hypothetical protein